MCSGSCASSLRSRCAVHAVVSRCKDLSEHNNGSLQAGTHAAAYINIHVSAPRASILSCSSSAWTVSGRKSLTCNRIISSPTSRMSIS